MNLAKLKFFVGDKKREKCAYEGGQPRACVLAPATTKEQQACCSREWVSEGSGRGIKHGSGYADSPTLRLGYEPGAILDSITSRACLKVLRSVLYDIGQCSAGAGVDIHKGLTAEMNQMNEIDEHYYCDEGTDEDPTPVHRCGQNLRRHSPNYTFREGEEPLAYQVWRSEQGEMIHESCAKTMWDREFLFTPMTLRQRDVWSQLSVMSVRYRSQKQSFSFRPAGRFKTWQTQKINPNNLIGHCNRENQMPFRHLRGRPRKVRQYAPRVILIIPGKSLLLTHPDKEAENASQRAYRRVA